MSDESQPIESELEVGTVSAWSTPLKVLVVLGILNLIAIVVLIAIILIGNAEAAHAAKQLECSIYPPTDLAYWLCIEG